MENLSGFYYTIEPRQFCVSMDVLMLVPKEFLDGDPSKVSDRWHVDLIGYFEDKDAGLDPVHFVVNEEDKLLKFLGEAGAVENERASACWDSIDWDTGYPLVGEEPK